MTPSKRQIIDLTLIESPDAKRIASEETVLAPTHENGSNPEKESAKDDSGVSSQASENVNDEYRVDLPDDFTPKTHPKVLSAIIDEAVMLYSDVKDKQYFRVLKAELEWGKAPRNAMKKILLSMETKYNLPPGTIKESTVRNRLKSYYMREENPSVSLVKDVDQRMIINVIATVKKNPKMDVEKTLDCLEIVIPLAKRVLKDIYSSLEPEKRAEHELIYNYIQFDNCWAQDFKRWALNVLKQPGILDAFDFD